MYILVNISKKKWFPISHYYFDKVIWFPSCTYMLHSSTCYDVKCYYNTISKAFFMHNAALVSAFLINDNMIYFDKVIWRQLFLNYILLINFF